MLFWDRTVPVNNYHTDIVGVITSGCGEGYRHGKRPLDRRCSIKTKHKRIARSEWQLRPDPIRLHRCRQ